MKKRRIIAALLIVATTAVFTGCGSDKPQEEASQGQSQIEEVKPIAKEEFFEKVNDKLKQYAEVVQKNSIGGHIIEERNDDASYGIYFDTYIEVASSKKPIEDGTVYYLLTENEEGKLTETMFNYYCAAVLRTPTFELDKYPVLNKHLEKIKEIDPKLDLKEIEKAVNDNRENSKIDHIFFDTAKDENINSKLEKGSLMLSFDLNEKNEKRVCIDYMISNDGIVE
ncbi:MAG: hypothetical protein MR639_13495 [Clostridium sp.]|uniref:hypothetical protein n=1 Tax=Clostridium sp. TaxID=1506 RepID=UPI002A8A4514|nr:hypothetical protein [Clostridium sp.]MDY5098843.1 hypothetical protein [Clostridium sp.]